MDRDALWPHWRDEWVVHRDEQLLVIDKPAGVASHPSELCEVSDVATRLTRRLGKKPAVLHALDREASGVMVLALDKRAAAHLARQLERGAPRRHLVGLTARPRGAWDLDIVERRGERVIAAVADKRQLRAALAEAGAPIAGDRDHGGAPAARLMWHAVEIALVHPARETPFTARAPLPEAFREWLDGEPRAPLRGVVERVRAAVERRYALGRRDDSDAFRLVHGAGDGLPGVEIDRYGDFAVVSLAGDDALGARDELCEAVAALGFRGVYLKLRPKRASTLVDTRAREVAPPLPLRGEPAPAPLAVRELGVSYLVRLGDGLSTGLFLDQRHARAWLRGHARGKSVLNLYGYHAAFTVAAAAGGAARSTTVDLSGAALARARENLAHAGAGAEHALVKADVEAWLERGRERFDVVLLDPPSFATSKRTTFRAERDYRRVAALAMSRVAPGGELYASTNLRRMSAERFRRELQAAARAAGRAILRARPMPPPLDFPPPPGEPWHLKSERLEIE